MFYFPFSLCVRWGGGEGGGNPVQFNYFPFSGGEAQFSSSISFLFLLVGGGGGGG